MWVLLSLACIFAYFVAHCFMTVYEMVIDTIFICFCEDCEMNDGLSKPYFMSKNLMLLAVAVHRKSGLSLAERIFPSVRPGMPLLSASTSRIGWHGVEWHFSAAMPPTCSTTRPYTIRLLVEASVLSAVVTAVDRHSPVDGFQGISARSFVQNGLGQFEEGLFDIDVRLGRRFVETDPVLSCDLRKNDKF
ncbi:unnamed protein product [Nesidiocoris tenuis]|uniref:Choline transporter-like protein n=1 Tax=Nesidiocoris tenuis TaxID=355587 RepID=A0A6H5HC48_9HEMI|nr:unnamed protein product [Nesidiocoris tenuis]